MQTDTWTPTMGEILEVQREPENERDCQTVCLLKLGMIVGYDTIRSYNGQYAAIATNKQLQQQIVEYVCMRMHFTASSKTRSEVCAYEKMCAYMEGGLNNQSLQYVCISWYIGIV